jgi:hypothetical protein
MKSEGRGDAALFAERGRVADLDKKKALYPRALSAISA